MRPIEIFVIIDSLVACVLGLVLFNINCRYKDTFSKVLTWLGVFCYLAGGFLAVIWLLRAVF